MNEEEKRLICNEYKSDKNISCSQLAKKYKRDRETISRVLKKNGIEVLPSGSSKANKIIVYDAFTNKVIFEETYIKDFCEYLKNNGVDNAKTFTISNHIRRNGKLLYKKYKVRKIGGD